LCPIVWYAAAAMHLFKYYNRDPRERPGLTACSITVNVIYNSKMIKRRGNVTYAYQALLIQIAFMHLLIYIRITLLLLVPQIPDFGRLYRHKETIV
jgi:hypothetical protein